MDGTEFLSVPIKNENNIIENDSKFKHMKDCCGACGLSLTVSNSNLNENENGLLSSLWTIAEGQKEDEDKNIVWCSQCNLKYHLKCTGVTYSPFVFLPDVDYGFCCQFCLDQKARLPLFRTHLGSTAEAVNIISQVSVCERERESEGIGEGDCESVGKDESEGRG